MPRCPGCGYLYPQEGMAKNGLDGNGEQAYRRICNDCNAERVHQQKANPEVRHRDDQRRDPAKVKARGRARWMEIYGHLIPRPCEYPLVGDDIHSGQIEKHHPDHSKGDEVIYYCRRHHQIVTNEELKRGRAKGKNEVLPVQHGLEEQALQGNTDEEALPAVYEAWDSAGTGSEAAGGWW